METPRVALSGVLHPQVHPGLCASQAGPEGSAFTGSSGAVRPALPLVPSQAASFTVLTSCWCYFVLVVQVLRPHCHTLRDFQP